MSFHCWKWGFWLRMFGRGFSIAKMPPLFSERYGYAKVIRVGAWRIKYLDKLDCQIARDAIDEC